MAYAAPAEVPPRFFRFVILCFCLFAALNAGVTWRLRDQVFEGYGDFSSFYTAGKIVASGESARLYDLPLQWQVQQGFAANVKIRRGPMPYIRPPFEALLFLPLAYLSYPAACMVWLAVKVLILIAIPFVLPGERPGRLLRILLCLGFYGVGVDLLQGQDAIVLLLVLAVAFRFLLRGAYPACGLVLGLGLFKFHLILPLVLILALRNPGARGFRMLGAFCATGLLLMLTSVGLVGWRGLLDYPRYLWALNQVPGLGMAGKRESMPNLRGILSAFIGSGPAPWFVHVLLAGVVVLGIVLATAWWRGTDEPSTRRGLALSIVIVLLTSYYANSYDLTLLLLPLLLWAGPVLRSGGDGWQRRLLMASAALLVCTPLLWIFAFTVSQFCWITVLVVAFGAGIFVTPLPSEVLAAPEL